MKKRKRKLTEEQRRAALLRAMREIERRKLNRKRRLVQRSATGPLYIAKIHPKSDKPRTVAKGLAQEIFDFPSSGAREVGWVIERRWKDKRFLGKMLIALGEYLLEGQPMFDDVDVDAANIKRLQPRITVSEIVSKLEKRHPNFTRDALEKRLRRLLKNIPEEYWQSPD